MYTRRMALVALAVLWASVGLTATAAAAGADTSTTTADTSTTTAGTTPAGTTPAGLEVAAARLRSDPVYVDPTSTALLPDSQAAQLRVQVEAGPAHVYVAVIPDSAASEVGGNHQQLPIALGRDLGVDGAVAVVTTKGFYANSSSHSGLAPGQAGELADAAFRAHHGDGPFATLTDWVTRVDQAVRATAGSTTSSNAGTNRHVAISSGSHHNSHGGLVLGLIILAVMAVLVWLIIRQIRKGTRAPIARGMGWNPDGTGGSQRFNVPPPGGAPMINNYGGAGPGYWHGGGYYGGSYYGPGFYSSSNFWEGMLVGDLLGGGFGGGREEIVNQNVTVNEPGGATDTTSWSGGAADWSGTTPDQSGGGDWGGSSGDSGGWGGGGGDSGSGGGDWGGSGGDSGGGGSW